MGREARVVCRTCSSPARRAVRIALTQPNSRTHTDAADIQEARAHRTCNECSGLQTRGTTKCGTGNTRSERRASCDAATSSNWAARLQLLSARLLSQAFFVCLLRRTRQLVHVWFVARCVPVCSKSYCSHDLAVPLDLSATSTLSRVSPCVSS